MTDFDPREARISEWAMCPRACACRIAGCEPAPMSEYAQRYLRRGELFEMYVAGQFVEKYGRENVQRQRVIKWPLGEGHADIYLPFEKMLVEVFSTTGGDIERKIKQVKLYLYFDGEAERACVYVVDPSTLERENVLPVKLTEEDKREIGWELSVLEGVADGGVLPPCVFKTPTECKFAGCAFTEAAWADYDAEVYELDDALPLVEQLAEQTEALREAEKEVRIRREQTLATKDALARAGLDAGRDYIIGPYKVRRTLVGPRSTFSLSTAKKAGYELPEHLLPFVKVSEGHERFTIKEAA